MEKLAKAIEGMSIEERTRLADRVRSFYLSHGKRHLAALIDPRELARDPEALAAFIIAMKATIAGGGEYDFSLGDIGKALGKIKNWLGRQATKAWRWVSKDLPKRVGEIARRNLGWFMEKRGEKENVVIHETGTPAGGLGGIPAWALFLGGGLLLVLLLKR